MIGHLPSFPGPLYQNEVKCSTFDMEMIFHSHANKTHFHKKCSALGLILKVRVSGTRKWLIHYFHRDHNALSLPTRSLHKLFPISLGYYSHPKGNRKQWLCKVLGINKVHYGLCENGEWYVSRAFLYFACVLLSGCLKSVSSCCSYIYAASRSQGDGEMKLQSLPLKK